MESLIIWGGVALLMLVIVVPYVIRFRKRDQSTRVQHEEAVAMGTDRPPTQHPQIDEIACAGCGACVDACPEGDVLGLVSGRAVIVNGMRCVGHGRCEDACPVGAIRIGLGNVTGRTDLPVLSPHNETSVPGLYVAGELSGFALIRNAINQGRQVIDHIAATALRAAGGAGESGVLDVIVVGAGPAGLAAALGAKQHGLSCAVLDQQKPGGTILQYPRKKLVLTQPVEVPLHGWLDRSEYTKEELLEIWESIPGRFDLDLRAGERVVGVSREGGRFTVTTESAVLQARQVVLALGRRGSPRRLGVPGEDRSKVAYQLLDADSYRDHDILVVGGGDSAVEAAMGLARQPGNRVTLSYRRPKLVRIRRRNADRIEPLLADGTITAALGTEVIDIGAESVGLKGPDGEQTIPNEHVFVFAGGEPPFAFLKAAGVTFGGGEGAEGRAPSAATTEASVAPSCKAS